MDRPARAQYCLEIEGRARLSPCSGESSLTRASEPRVNDCLVAGGDRRALVNVVRVGLAERSQVVPDHRATGLRLDRAAEVDERSLAAAFGLVQIQHEGPAALAPGRGGEPFQLVRLE